MVLANARLLTLGYSPQLASHATTGPRFPTIRLEPPTIDSNGLFALHVKSYG